MKKEILGGGRLAELADVKKDKAIEPVDIVPIFAKKPIRSVRDAKKMLSRIIHVFQSGTVSSEHVKTLCYLLTSWVSIVNSADFENRLSEIELRLKVKKK